jgi:pimeloyl-ACP methyl ester carboxylesterase
MPTVDRNGVGIYYELEGDGSPLVLHTGAGGDLAMWRLAGYSDGLRDRHRLILIDHRGHGKSSRPADVRSHRIQEYRDDVLAVLDATDSRRAAFIGYSYGARVGYALAESDPERVSALIDLDGTTADHTEPAVQRAVREFIREIRARGLRAGLIDMAMSEGLSTEHPIVQNLLATDAEMFALELEGGLNWRGPLSVLRHLQVPCLVLLDGLRQKDDLAETVRVLEAAAGRAQIVEGLGHIRTFIESGRTLPLIRDFLLKHTS